MTPPKAETVPVVSVKFTCPCGGSFEMEAPVDLADAWSRKWRADHRGHPTSPGVVPTGATSGDISLRAGVETFGQRGRL